MVSRLRALSLVTFALAGALLQQCANAQNVTQPIVRVTDIVVNEVNVVEGQLVAAAEVTLDILGRTVSQAVDIPLTLGGIPGDACDILHLEVGPVNLDLLGLVVNLDDCDGGPVVVDIDAFAGEGLLGDLLCNLAGGLLGGVDLGDLLSGLLPTQLDALTGALTATLNNLFTELLDAGVAAPAQQHANNAQHVCEILMLEIPDGVTLSVLGLVVDTSAICLDVHAESGSGNLLGNLLCNLSHLLDGRSNGNARQAQVQNILRLLDRLGL